MLIESCSSGAWWKREDEDGALAAAGPGWRHGATHGKGLGLPQRAGGDVLEVMC